MGHQTYELWFKQILFELNAIIIAFNNNKIEEKVMLTMLSRLHRIETIFDLLINQFKVIETMTPMDFLEFRDYLVPASGFQSLQFRELSIRMGISETTFKRFYEQLPKHDRLKFKEIKNKPKLFKVIDDWLSRMPFLSSKNFYFWK